MEPAAEDLVLVEEKAGLRLDLACGVDPEGVPPGFEGVDIVEGAAKHVVDLMKFPLPWADGSVAAIRCSHFIEHLPNREVETRDIRRRDGVLHVEDVTRYVGQDFLLAFFDECYRMLEDDGKMEIVVPCARSDRAYQDPTHRRYINEYTFLYLNPGARKMLRVEHYRVACAFNYTTIPIGDATLQGRTDEAIAYRFRHEWNRCQDWVVHLTKVKTGA